MITHTVLCYSLYSRECLEHEWPLRSAGTDLVRCGDLGALLGLRREYSAAFGRASRDNHQGAAPHAAALSSAAHSARLHVVEHGTEAAPTARATASGSGHGPAEAVEERGFVGTM